MMYDFSIRTAMIDFIGANKNRSFRPFLRKKGIKIWETGKIAAPG
jgi:hypothetical protein